ncbi:MAG TPA: hypothetical protein PLA90_18315, partial [Candidatus Sumerlaeota bacterium]|nr:hypothetical protein [Candidatus Sumerlaeota bacterium]
RGVSEAMSHETEQSPMSAPSERQEVLARAVREFLDARERGTRHIEHQALARMKAALEETEGNHRK